MRPGWGWFSMIDKLAGGDITKHELIFKTSWVYCLTKLLYMKHTDEYINKLNKQMQAESQAKTKTIRKR